MTETNGGGTSSLTQRVTSVAAAQAAGTAVPARRDDQTVLGWLNDPTTTGELAKALPRGFDAARFARIVQTEVRKNPRLLECDRSSFVLAVLNAAQLGLEPGPLGHAYLLPYRIKGTMTCNLILGYKGLKDLAYRSDTIDYLDAVPVHEGEPFTIRRGSDPGIVHEELPGCAEAAVVSYYAIAIPKGGGRAVFEVMWPKDVDAIRKRSRAKDDGPWVTDYEAMALKTVTRRMLNRGKVRLTPQVASAIASDEERELGFEKPDMVSLAALAPIEAPPIEGTAEPVAETGDATKQGEQSAGADTPAEPGEATAPTDATPAAASAEDPPKAPRRRGQDQPGLGLDQ